MGPDDYDRSFTDQEEQAYATAMARPDHSVVASFQAFDVSAKSFRRLQSGCWLNDDVINYCTAILNARDSHALYLDTIFCTLLKRRNEKYDYQKIVQCTTPQHPSGLGKLFVDPNVTMLFVPAHVRSTHWTVVCADLEAHTVTEYNSLHHSSRSMYAGAIRHFMQDIYTQHGATSEPQPEAWPAKYARYAPQQADLCSCGAFMLMTASWLALDASTAFDYALRRGSMGQQEWTQAGLQQSDQMRRVIARAMLAVSDEVGESGEAPAVQLEEDDDDDIQLVEPGEV
ncbi:hypothetical protein JKP88DRAFT_285325 [Tribonema minus]|uniref:Ubiquitin-like protease family profile domain-containing protein n=1 Tax=Tribonema minus TaxID=303371 RepID=A0A836CPW9_9STRA|nr:hypothetical protein JKP88DRAFT_285325 [Tribonema minus]